MLRSLSFDSLFQTGVAEPLSTHTVPVCDNNNFNNINLFYGLNIYLFLNMS
jgi:hypothetical protein